MSGAKARAWLALRTPAPPAALLAHMDAALAQLPVHDSEADEPDHDLADALGRAALACLGRALNGGTDRAAAYDLLAADALLTYGCEAAADGHPDDVVRFAGRYGAGRLGQLLR